MVLGNAFILDKENVNRLGHRTVREFRLPLAKQLIGGSSQEAASLEPCVIPENAVGHFISRREGNACKRHCIQCKKDGQ